MSEIITQVCNTRMNTYLVLLLFAYEILFSMNLGGGTLHQRVILVREANLVMKFEGETLGNRCGIKYC